MSYKNGVLEASGLDFGGLGLDFGGSEAPFFQDFCMIFGHVYRELAEICRDFATL